MEEALARRNTIIQQQREGLALVEGITKFKPYLHDRKFVVYTDRSSLRWLMKVKDATARLAR